MPAAPLPEREDNLRRLVASFQPHHRPMQARKDLAARWAREMPLSHATSLKGLHAILGGSLLRSQQALGRPGGYAETMMDTRDDVFLYTGAFAYPNTECGFLFLRSVEDGYAQDKKVATPFDSGGLAKHVSLPPGWADSAAFVRGHELPVSGYRELLELHLASYTPSLEEFLTDASPRCGTCFEELAHSLGLLRGNRRCNLFEVRLATQVPVMPPHLHAVFIRDGLAPRALLHPLLAAGVEIVTFSAPDDKIFDTLRESCITFLLDFLKP